MDWSYIYHFLPFIWNVQHLVSAISHTCNTAITSVHGLQGGTVIFPLGTVKMENGSDLILTKNNGYIFKLKKNFTDARYEGRLTIHGDRTMRLDRLEEQDAGLYEIEIFDMSGLCIHKAKTDVIVTCVKGFSEVHGDYGAPLVVFGENLIRFSEARWERNGSLVAQLNRSGPIYSVEYRGRVEILPSGVCKFIKAHVSDGGNHLLVVSDGGLRLTWSAQLFITVPRPKIEASCLSAEKAEFHCSVNSSIPTRWILNGIDLEQHSVPNETHLILDAFAGELFCAVKEHPHHNTSVLFMCADQKTSMIVIILAASVPALTMAILSGAGIYLFSRRRQEQTCELTTMVPKEINEICEKTDAEEFPPPPPPVLEKEEQDCPDTSPVMGMSTFIF